MSALTKLEIEGKFSAGPTARLGLRPSLQVHLFLHENEDGVRDPVLHTVKENVLEILEKFFAKPGISEAKDVKLIERK